MTPESGKMDSEKDNKEIAGKKSPETVARSDETGEFKFVRVLAEDMSTGEFDLPSWPAVMLQIRRALANPSADIKEVVRLIGSDPVLAARVLKVANSPFSGSRTPVSDLKTAVNRLGFDMVRNLAISLAMNQIFHGQPKKQLQPFLAEFWLHSTTVAALSFFLAKRVPDMNPDEAFLGGLLHDIGKLYVLMRADGYQAWFDSRESLLEVMEEWHSSIGRAIVESWNFSGELVDAVGDHELYDEERRGGPKLTDVVAVANLLANRLEQEDEDGVDLDNVASCQRLDLNAQSCEEMVHASSDEVKSLRQALGL